MVGLLGTAFGVPRRCPVDDAPHTTCTSPDYDTTQYPAGTLVVVAVRRPGVLDAMADDAPMAPAVDAVSAPVTTAAYRRPRKVRTR